MVLGAAIATEGGPMLRLSRLEPHLGSLSLLLALCLLGLGVGTLHGNADRLVTVNRAILASPGLQDSLSPPARRALAREQAAVESDTVRAQVALAFGAASAFLLIVLGFALPMRREIGTRRRIEADHDRLFNLSLDMLAVAGFDGYFKDINPSWERTLGWSRHELMSAVPYLE
ncbi:MAG: PAS domain-containing protein [Kiritimatiellia bacterium]